MPSRALAAAALTAMAWGLTGIFVFLLPRVSAFYIAGGRLLVGFICVLPWLLLSARARTVFIAAAMRPVSYVFAALLSAYYLFATSAFQHAPVAEVALLLCSAPLMVLCLRRLGGDHPSRREVGGAALALLGLLWILAPRLMHESAPSADNHLLGDALALAAAACTALYARSYAKLQARAAAPSPLGTTFLTLMGGSIVLLACAAVMGLPLPASVFTRHEGGLLLGLGVLCTGIPSLSFAYASQHLPPLLTATISLLIPVFAAIFAALWLDQLLPLAMLPGCIVLLGGVGLIVFAPASAK